MKPSWLPLVDDTTFLRSLYGDEGPPLTGVEMHELVMHRDGPSVTLRFDLASFATSPPAKWQGANVVQVELALFVVTRVSVNGLGTSNVGDLELAPATPTAGASEPAAGGAGPRGVRARFASDGMTFEAFAEHARIAAVRAYTREP